MNSNCFFGLNDKPRFFSCVLVAQAVLSLLAANIADAETFDLTNRSSTSDYAPKAEPAQAAKSAGAFVPKGWTEDSSADGDLNKDNRSDCALVVSSEDPNNFHRRLLILLRGADGLLHKSVDSEGTLIAACGPSGGTPQVSIKNGVLIIHQYCGARDRYDSSLKYQLRDGQWLLIGCTNDLKDANAEMSEQKVDVNTLTGDVSGWIKADKSYNKSNFREVRSPLIEEKEPSVTDWAAPATWLNYKSPTCPIVSVQSVHNTNQLFVRVQLQGSNALSEKEVHLLDEKHAPISPVAVRKTPYGYVLATYDLNSPQLKAALKTARASSEDPGDDSDALLRITVDVGPHECGCDKSFTTGHVTPGGILLTKTQGPPRLQDVKITDGGFPHPFLWKLPE